MRATRDAVVIGAGPNGLVAANRLADAGWDVLVLEALPHVGGAVHSDCIVHADFVHDTFSSFYPLAVASPTIRSLRLEEYGLKWRHAPAVLGHPRRDGSWALLHRDRHDTARGLDEFCAGDGEAWLDLCSVWDRIGDAFVQALLAPFPPFLGGLAALRRLPSVGGLQFVRRLLTPAADPALWPFRGEAPRLLLTGNAGHSDIPVHAPGSGLMGILMSMLGQTVGFPVPEGGASALATALARRLQDRGGEIRCGHPVTRVVVRDGRVVAVRVDDGTEIAVRRAVIADVVAPNLFGGLVLPADLPARTRRGMQSFTLDPGTVKVDWALAGEIPWESSPSLSPGTVHVADDIADLGQALGQVSSGLVPAHPFLLMGQMTTADPTRSPEGTESAWAYTHVPQDVRGDVGEGGLDGRWTLDQCERFADRMQARVEKRAPGFASRVITRRVLGPHELQERDPNLLGGAINGGTSQLHQQLVFRPIPGLGRAETGIAGLYLGSASAHPGGGVHGAPGNNAARAALWHDRLNGVPRRLGRRA